MAAMAYDAHGRFLGIRRFVPREDGFLMSSRSVVIRSRRKAKLADADGCPAASPKRARQMRTCGQCGELVRGKHRFSNAFYPVLCRKCFYGFVLDEEGGCV